MSANRPSADVRQIWAKLAPYRPKRTLVFGKAELSNPMASERFAYIWSYEIEPTRKQAFLKAYKPGGEWARLFSRDPSYIQTALFRDVEHENRYVTIDYWKSKADKDSFRERYSVEFDELDNRCEAFTREECFLGDFIDFGEVSN